MAEQIGDSGFPGLDNCEINRFTPWTIVLVRQTRTYQDWNENYFKDKKEEFEEIVQVVGFQWGNVCIGERRFMTSGSDEGRDTTTVRWAKKNGNIWVEGTNIGEDKTDSTRTVAYGRAEVSHLRKTVDHCEPRYRKRILAIFYCERWDRLRQ